MDELDAAYPLGRPSLLIQIDEQLTQVYTDLMHSALLSRPVGGGPDRPS